MEFDWSQDDLQHRAEFQAFLREFLPEDWERLSEAGPGSDLQAEFRASSAASWLSADG